MASVLDHALQLAERGLRVFPLVENTGLPAIKEWPDKATSDPAIIREWFEGEHRRGNYGVATGNGLFVVDADVKKENGLAALEEMDLCGADLEFLVDSPSGGRHAYFRLPEGCEDIPNSVKALKRFPGIDIRGHRGFVVGPGSVKESGAYTIRKDNGIPEAPLWLIDEVRANRTIRERAGAAPLIELDTEPAIQQAIMYLKHDAPEAVENFNGNDTTYRVIARVKDYGLSKDKAIDLVLAHYNEEKAIPPWDPDDLADIADNVYAFGTSAPGAKSALLEFEAVDLSADSDLFTIPTTLHGDPPVREWISPGTIPKGHVTLLYGDGGLGKTLLAQQLATAMGTGRQWLGRDVAKGAVLAVFSEDDTDELWRRQVDINRSENLHMDDLGAITWMSADHVAKQGAMLMSFATPEGKFTTFFRTLSNVIEARKPDLLILDPIANMFGGNEIDRAQVTAFVNRALKSLCVRYGLTVLALAHPSVSGMATGRGSSGSTGWNNAVRSRLYLSRPKNDPTGDYRDLEGMKANYGKTGKIATLRWKDGVFLSVAGTDADPDIVADRALLGALRALDDRGVELSPNNRAKNYVIRKAQATPETNGLTREALEAALERLIGAGVVWTEERMGKDRHMREMICVLSDNSRNDDL